MNEKPLNQNSDELIKGAQKFAKKVVNRVPEEKSVKSGMPLDSSQNSNELGDLFSKFTIKREFTFPSNGIFGYKSISVKPLTLEDELKIKDYIMNIYSQTAKDNQLTPEYSYELLNRLLEYSIYDKDKKLIEYLSLNDYLSLLFFIFLYNSPKKQIVIGDQTYRFDDLEVILLDQEKDNLPDFIKRLFKEIYDITGIEITYENPPELSIFLPTNQVRFDINLWEFFKNYKEVSLISTNLLNPPSFVKIYIQNNELPTEHIDQIIKKTEIGKYVYTILVVLATGTDSFKLYYGLPVIIEIGENNVKMEELISMFFRGILYS